MRQAHILHILSLFPLCVNPTVACHPMLPMQGALQGDPAALGMLEAELVLKNTVLNLVWLLTDVPSAISKASCCRLH